MIIDKSLELVKGVSFVGATGTAGIGDIIDLAKGDTLPTRSDYEISFGGENLKLVLTFANNGSNAFARGDDARNNTYEFKISSGPTTNGDGTALGSTETYTAPVLATSQNILDSIAERRSMVMNLPFQIQSWKRYIQVTLTRTIATSGTADTNGLLYAYLVAGADVWRAYPDATN